MNTELFKNEIVEKSYVTKYIENHFLLLKNDI